MKKLLALCILISGLPLFGQETNLTTGKQRLLILPASGADKRESLESRITALVAGEATRLGRFEIIDRNNLEGILEEQALQLSGIIRDEEVVEIGRIAAAPEALLINLLNFGQKGVPPEDEKKQDQKDREKAREAGLLGIITKGVVDAAVDKALEDVERYPNNIQTVLQFEVRKLNLESGQAMAAFTVNAEHTGGNKTASLSRTLNKASWNISRELREMYLLSSEVLDVRGREVLLLLGQDMGLRPGTLFFINTPDSKRQVGGREITIPGRQVGVVEVTEISTDANRGRVLRRWDRIEPGYRAVESTGGIFSGGLSAVYGRNSRDMGLDFALFLAPLRRIGGSLFLGLGTIDDTRQDTIHTDFRVRMGGDLHLRVLHTNPFSLAGVISLPLNLVVRDDDENNTVSALLFNPRVGIRTEIMVSPRLDLVASAGYCFSSGLSKWDYSKKEEDSEESKSYPAEWHNNLAPGISARGPYITLGLRFLIFMTADSGPGGSRFPALPFQP